MRGGGIIALALLGFASGALGCARGSTTDDESLESAPIVALSAPGQAHLPDLEGARSAGDLAREPKVPAFSRTMPFALVACKKGAFCDDFEGAAPGSRWSGSVAADGAVDFTGQSSSLGARSLHATTNGAGAAAAAHLTLAGASLGGQWVGELGFSLRLDALPGAVIGGPEIVVVDGVGAQTRIGFSVRPEGIALHQHFESCSGSSCTSRSDLVTDVKPGEWRHLVVAIETTNRLAPPYGRIEVTVDGGPILLLPLMVAPFDGRAEAHAGITVGDSVPASLDVDDVMFYAR